MRAVRSLSALPGSTEEQRQHLEKERLERKAEQEHEAAEHAKALKDMTKSTGSVTVHGLSAEEEEMRAQAAAKAAAAKEQEAEMMRSHQLELQKKVQNTGAATVHGLDASTEAMRAKAKVRGALTAKFAIVPSDPLSPARTHTLASIHSRPHPIDPPHVLLRAPPAC